jgi:hypothetical protein
MDTSELLEARKMVERDGKQVFGTRGAAATA